MKGTPSAVNSSPASRLGCLELVRPRLRPAFVASWAWTLSQGPLSNYTEAVRTGIPVVISLMALWFAFRIVNWPRFADFLISVEAEMDKVTWASREELQRATIVVIATMVFIGLILFVYDLFWVWLFTLLRILQPVIY